MLSIALHTHVHELRDHGSSTVGPCHGLGESPAREGEKGVTYLEPLQNPVSRRIVSPHWLSVDKTGEYGEE